MTPAAWHNNSKHHNSMSQQVTEIGRFNGILAPFAVAAFFSLRRFLASPGACHKLASDYVSDLGRAIASSDQLKATVGKALKEGGSKFKISGSTSATLPSAGSKIVRCVQQMEGLSKEGLLLASFSLEKSLDFALQKAIEEAQQWADEQWSVSEEKAA